MYKKIGVLSGIILLLVIHSVLAAPQPPHQFYGNVTIDGSPAPEGTEITVKIDGVGYGSTTTSDGKYGYDPLFFVPADDPSTDEKEGGQNGDVIQFYVNDVLSGTYNFSSGDVTNLDLSASSITLTPSPTPTSTPSAGGGGEVEHCPLLPLQLLQKSQNPTQSI